MDEDDAQPKLEGAVKNWLLLETEIVNVLREQGWQITNNSLGDAYIFLKENYDRDLNITHLAQALTRRVLVRIAPLSAKEDTHEGDDHGGGEAGSDQGR
jgi:hypothetical protein